MKCRKQKSCVLMAALLAFAIGVALGSPVAAQHQELMDRVAEVSQETAQNKQVLAQFTWVEQVTISMKGEERKQEHFQVRLGPDGNPRRLHSIHRRLPRSTNVA